MSDLNELENITFCQLIIVLSRTKIKVLCSIFGFFVSYSLLVLYLGQILQISEIAVLLNKPFYIKIEDKWLQIIKENIWVILENRSNTVPDEGKITLKIKVKNEYDYETINIGKIISQKGKIKSSPFFGIIGSINIFQNAHAQEEFQWYGHGKNFKFYERIYSGDTIKRYYDDGWILEYKVDEYGSSIRGSYKWIKEDHKGAIENYTKTITRDPKNIYAYINRGLTRFDLKDYKGAIEDYKEALALDPGNVSVYDYRGDAYLKLENFEAAIKDYTEALARDPNYIVAYNDRGNAYLKQRNYKAAIKDYDEALARDPVNVYAYIKRGVARLRDGNRQGALADYEKAAELYKQQGKTPEYQETLNKIQELKQ